MVQCRVQIIATLFILQYQSIQIQNKHKSTKPWVTWHPFTRDGQKGMFPFLAQLLKLCEHSTGHVESTKMNNSVSTTHTRVRLDYVSWQAANYSTHGAPAALLSPPPDRAAGVTTVPQVRRGRNLTCATHVWRSDLLYS